MVFEVIRNANYFSCALCAFDSKKTFRDMLIVGSIYSELYWTLEIGTSGFRVQCPDLAQFL